jgi:asparagine synthase (glutamine-hydrolysing)
VGTRIKDYPIEENSELTIRSVIDNLMLYQEGWGVGRIKYLLIQRRPQPQLCERTRPARRGFPGFSPYPARRRRSRGGDSICDHSPAMTCRRSTQGEVAQRGVKAVNGTRHAGLPEAPFSAWRLAGRRDEAATDGTEQSSPRFTIST